MRNALIMAVAAALQTAKDAATTVDPSANALAASAIDPKPYEGGSVKSNIVKSHMGNVVSRRVGQYNMINFEVELNGSGTAGTAPAWGILMQACGYIEVIDPGVSVGYSFVESNVIDSTKYAKIECYLDGEQHTVPNARGKVSFDFNAEGLPVAKFDFIGDYVKPVHLAAMPTFNYDAFKLALPVSSQNTPVWKLIDGVDEYDVVGKSFSVDDGLSQSYKDAPNYKGHIYTGERNGTSSMTIDAPPINTLDLYAKSESHQTVSFIGAKLQHGFEAGQILELDCPKMQISALSRSESDGIMQYGLSLDLIPIDGDDEFTLTVR